MWQFSVFCLCVVGHGLGDWASVPIRAMDFSIRRSFFLLEGPAADATDALQPWRLIVQPYEEDDNDDDVFFAFPF